MDRCVYVASYRCKEIDKLGSAYVGAFVFHRDPNELLPKGQVLTGAAAVKAVSTWGAACSYAIYQIHPRYMNDFRDGSYHDLRLLVDSKVPYVVSVLEVELGIPLEPIAIRRGTRRYLDPNKARLVGVLGFPYTDVIYGSDYPALSAAIDTLYEARWHQELQALLTRWPHYKDYVNNDYKDVDFVPFEQHRKYALESFAAKWVEQLQDGSGPAFFRFYLDHPPAWWSVWFKDLPFTHWLTEAEFTYVLREFRPVYPREFQNWLRRTQQSIMPNQNNILESDELYYYQKKQALARGVGNIRGVKTEPSVPVTELDKYVFTPIYGDLLL